MILSGIVGNNGYFTRNMKVLYLLLSVPWIIHELHGPLIILLLFNALEDDKLSFLKVNFFVNNPGYNRSIKKHNLYS